METAHASLPAGGTFLELNKGFLFHARAAVWQCNWCQTHHRNRIVVRSDPVLPFGSAAVAPVHQHLLPVCAECHTDSGHQRSAGALAVTWSPQIDVPGGQAEGTVVPVLST
ncbi:MAG: hypothetical protein U0075_07475 [Thermomicrobiales bacterium]